MRDAYVLPVSLFLSLGAALTSESGIWLFLATLVLTALHALTTLICE